MDFQLIVYLNKSDPGTTYELDNSYIVGRNKACGIRILSNTVSSEHCTLILMPKTKCDKAPYYVIRDGVFADNQSRNGTFVNGGDAYGGKQRLTEITRLKHQDEITFGGQYPKAVFLESQVEYNKEKETFATEPEKNELQP